MPPKKCPGHLFSVLWKASGRLSPGRTDLPTPRPAAPPCGAPLCAAPPCAAPPPPRSARPAAAPRSACPPVVCPGCGFYIIQNKTTEFSRLFKFLLLRVFPGHALHEKISQRQWGDGTLVTNWERRAAVALQINRGETTGFVPRRFT